MTVENQYYAPVDTFRSGSSSDSPVLNEFSLPPSDQSFAEPTFESPDHDLDGNHNMTFMPEVYPSAESGTSTHGINLPEVGGHVAVSPDVDPELAAAAVDADHAVIVHEGLAYIAPIDAINPDAVELCCNDEGCALIPDDGNPDNDIHVHNHTTVEHVPETNDDWVSF